MNKLTDTEKAVIELRRKHQWTWRDKADDFWLLRLHEEVSELHLSIKGKHKDSPLTELKQIAAVCINWAEKIESEV